MYFKIVKINSIKKYYFEGYYFLLELLFRDLEKFFLEIS